MGFLTVRRRCLTTRGVQPVGSVQPVFEWFDVDGAVAPTTRERCLLAVPSLNAETCQIFVDAFAHACPDHLDILLVENSGAHTAQRGRWPKNIPDVWLPPDGPELNPIEWVWRALKDELAWLQCTDLDAQQASVGALLQAYDAPTLLALTGEAQLAEPINALCS
jgi:putative transposase